MNIIDMFKNFKEDMNKSVNDSVGKKSSREMKVKIESLRKTQTEIKLEIKNL